MLLSVTGASGVGFIMKRGRSRGRSINEALHYLAMEVTPPPFRTARLVSWGEEGLTLTYLEGEALGAGKILDRDVPRATARQCLALSLSTGDWTSPVDGHRFDYRRQLGWGCEHGLLSSADLDVLLDHEQTADRRFQHGDLIPANVIVDADGVGVIDFEWSGRNAVNGLDWATLLVNGWKAESLRTIFLRSQIARTADGILNWAAVICHELRQVERDGDQSRWAQKARDLYEQQIPSLRDAMAQAMK